MFHQSVQPKFSETQMWLSTSWCYALCDRSLPCWLEIKANRLQLNTLPVTNTLPTLLVKCLEGHSCQTRGGTQWSSMWRDTVVKHVEWYSCQGRGGTWWVDCNDWQHTKEDTFSWSNVRLYQDPDLRSVSASKDVIGDLEMRSEQFAKGRYEITSPSGFEATTLWSLGRVATTAPSRLLVLLWAVSLVNSSHHCTSLCVCMHVRFCVCECLCLCACMSVCVCVCWFVFIMSQFHFALWILSIIKLWVFCTFFW